MKRLGVAKKTFAHQLLVAGLALGASVLSQAQVANGSFELSPNFQSWGLAGDNQIQGNSIGINPTDGVKQALLATATDGSVNPNVTAGTGVAEGNLTTLLNLNSGALSAASGSIVLVGSAIGQLVALGAGDTISFSWDFMTNQTYNDGTAMSIAPSTANKDFSFFSVAPISFSGSSQISILADTFYGYAANPSAPGGFVTGLTMTAPTNPFLSETGYHTYSYTAATSGTYRFGVGVAHVRAASATDNGVNSALLVDKFAVTSAPEPASFGVIAILGLGVLVRRRKK